MASFSTTASVNGSRISLDDGDFLPPDGNGRDYGPPDFEARLRRARLGLGVAVTGIVMVFVSFTSAYIVRQGLPTLDPYNNTMVRDWLPVRLPGLLLYNTLVLLISTLTMELARRQAARETAQSTDELARELSFDQSVQIPWLAMTIVLGLGFLAGQWLAWRQLAARGFYVATSASSSFVYLLTGMHGIHLIGGVLALLVAGTISVLRRPAQSRRVVVDVAAWYWHFMTLLWVYIFCLLEFAR